MAASAALLWLIAGLVLLGLLALGVDLDGLMAAGVAALLLSLLVSLLPMPAGLQIVAFGSVTLVLLWLLQRWSSRRRAGTIPPAPSSEQAQVISGFAAPQLEAGRVRWQGQSWAAVNLEPDRAIHPGEAVVVMGRDGTTLQVMRNPRSPGS